MEDIVKISPSRTSILLILVLLSLNVQAQDYPFNLPGAVTATLSVTTTQKEEFKDELLGYNIEYFKTNQEKDFIRKFNPVSIRFPSGVWSNFYEWQTDGYQNDSWDNGSHEPALEVYVRSIKGHINEIASLSKEKEEKEGKGFSMMWTYSMNFDDAESCVARAKKDIALGLEVKDIELGNEHFWKTQRSNQTATEADFLNRASSVANALHKEFPEVRVSIPLGWRRNQEAYNKAIIGDKQYYDAISLHRYMGADPDVPGESNTAYSAILTSRLILDEDAKWIRSHAGEKPIWLTEWGVSANKDVEVNSAACLGMADVYLYMSENQDIYDRANWFIFNKNLNPFVVVENRRPVYPLQKRGYLMVYEMLQEVFMGGEMLESSIEATQLKTGMNAVNARIVEKDGVKKVIAVNLANKPASLALSIDGKGYRQSYTHHALVFEELGPVANIDIDADPKILVKEGGGSISLPALSVSIIALSEEGEEFPILSSMDSSTPSAYPNPSTDGVFFLSKPDRWDVYSFSGQRLFSGQGVKVDLSAHDIGIYVLRTKTSTQKLIVK
ncbi:MAG: T9SS type A sorting domain-containing protein [Cyclobacteriaceae bacterium]